MIKATAKPFHRSLVCVFHLRLSRRTTINHFQSWTTMLFCVLVCKRNWNNYKIEVKHLFLDRLCLGGHLCRRPPSLTGTGNTADCLGVDLLPALNATSKNIWQECSAWQRGKVGGPRFVATLKAYFDTTAPFECNLKLFLCYALYLSLSL